MSLRLAGLALLGLLLLGFLNHDEHPAQAARGWLEPAALDLKPRYALADSEGRPVSDLALRGRPVLLTFGTAGCDEACQTLLREQAAALDALEAAGDGVAFLFVTLDPARDTPARLKAFTEGLDPRLLGLRGTPAAVAATAATFHLAYDDEPGQAMAFPVMTYLLDGGGNLRQLLPAGMTAAEIAALLEPLLEG